MCVYAARRMQGGGIHVVLYSGSPMSDGDERGRLY